MLKEFEELLNDKILWKPTHWMIFPLAHSRISLFGIEIPTANGAEICIDGWNHIELDLVADLKTFLRC